MQRKNLLKLGIAGTVVTAICCFTPALVVLLSAVGLSAWLAWLAWLDPVLIPLLVVFIAITAFAFMGMASAARHSESSDESTE